MITTFRKWLAGFLLLFFLIPANLLLVKQSTILAQEKTENKILALVHWFPVGFDYDNKPLLKNRLFPWQKTDESLWGRNGYPMTKTLSGPETTPLFYTILYLDLLPDNEKTKASSPLYIVLDDTGSIWFDRNGKFQNPLYDASRDPSNPLFVSGSCKEAALIDGKIRFSIDPSPENNTQGPYPINTLLTGGSITVQIQGRKFLIGLLDRTDYLENTMIQEKDWDLDFPLIPFQNLEVHAENVNGNGSYDPFEWIYRLSSAHSAVQAGDIRLSPVVVPGSTSVYEPNTVVLPGDLDIGYPVVAFLGKELHHESVPADGQYTTTKKYGFDFFQEFIYKHNPSSTKTAISDVRLTPVNVNHNPVTGLRRSFGLTREDGFIFAEISETNLSQNYAVETNYLALDPSMNLSIKLMSKTSDIPGSRCTISRGTLVEGDSQISVNFLQNLRPRWVGFLGFEWFLDNGKNNKMAGISNNHLFTNNLSDDYLVDGYSEEILGLYSRSGDLDYRKTLSSLPSHIRYYDSGSSGFGAGIPYYRDIDNSYTVSEGDERLIDISVSQTSNFTYYAGSFVTTGDLDAGFTLSDIPGSNRYLDIHPAQSDLTNNGWYDLGEPIYQKQASSFNLGLIEAGDFRITDSTFTGAHYDRGTYVAPCVFFYHQSKVHGLTNGLSGDFRNFDNPILCGSASFQILGNPKFQVELTTTFEIQFDPIKRGEKVLLILDGPSKRTELTPDMMVKKEIVGPYDGPITITITPYMGSFSEKGKEYPLSILAWLDTGGLPIQMPRYEDTVLQSNFFEPFYDQRDKKYSEVLAKDFYPDTHTILEEFVYPENLDIFPSKKCISQFDTRFPNMWAKTKDQNNPDDINDPYSILASFAGNNLFANYNAKGAGIDYLLTTSGYLSDKPNEKQNFIVQVNTNQSYFIWQWNDKAPVGVLNFGDILSTNPIIIDENPSFSNNDCSVRFILDPKDPIGFNVITSWDTLGIFNGQDHFITIDGITLILSNGIVENFGVPVLLSNYGSLSEADPGGDFPIALLPQFGNQEISFRVYTTSIQYDYNSTIQHPPEFISSRKGSLQYWGFYTLKAPVINDVNFTNLAIVDHGLQYSDVNYTAGVDALSPLNDPIITAPYNPLLMDYERDFTVYPAGQAHVARTAFRIGGNQRFQRGASIGYNAYPSITSISDPLSTFRKLGTENSPLTDYSFYFTLQTKSGEYLRFDTDAPTYLRIDRIVVEGPMKTTKIINTQTGSVIPDTGYPITYEYSGKLVIDREISKWYQNKGDDWTGRIGFGRNEIFFQKADYNPLLVRTKVLNFTGFPYVFKIPEIIPTQGGRLQIKVYLADGTLVELGDCCASKPQTGIKVHGLTIENVPDSIEINVSQSLKPVLREFEDNQDSTYCNNAYVYLWQDRGIRLYLSQLMDPIEMGSGDGRINMNNNAWADLNLDGKISFGDFETEIIGTYDIASNTWAGGVYDGRTFNVDNGVYPLELTEASNTLITQFGSDFGSRIGKSYSRSTDHIISSDEECPVYISSYKFYDDNNDRAFTPVYRRMSHEVYLAGEKRILMRPKEDLIIDTYPSPLTAGCIPEIIDPTTPLTFTVTDSSGKPLDFGFGVMDPQGNSNILAEDAHQHLFDDQPTEPLPQYYWTRTDLHNKDLGYDNNNEMYSKPGQDFSPIIPDFSKSSEGKYKFLNFCANDEGLFEVRIYSPDHLKMGRTWVRVVPPKVEYTIMPMMLENNFLRGMMDITDPDFLMTAAINRIYNIQVKASNAQGQLIKGIDKKNPFRNPDDRNVIVHSGRLTPYSSKPASFDLHLNFPDMPDPYFLHLLFPRGSDRPELKYTNIFKLAGFGVENQVYYNTTNVQYDSGLFSKTGSILANPTTILSDGWGYGAIYNYPREGVYMFADQDGDKKLTKADSLDIAADGTARFILFAEDVCRFGVLVSSNYFTDSDITGDVVGKAPDFAKDPLTIRGRYRKIWDSKLGYSMADTIFGLDWDAFPELDLKIMSPRITVENSETKFAYRRDLLSPINYDLTYAIPNPITVLVRTADPRDIPLSEGVIRVQGNTAESYVYGSMDKTDETRSISFQFTPTGVGEGIASLLFTNVNRFYDRKNPLFEGPGQYIVDLNTKFDSIRAIQVIFPAGSRLIAGFDNDLVVKISEKGTNAPITQCSVSVSYTGFSQTFTTNDQGEVVIKIKPTDKDIVRIYAYKDNFIESEAFLKAVKP